MFKKKFLLLALALFMAMFGTGLAVRFNNAKADAKVTAYTIVWKIVQHDSNGKSEIIGTETRFKSSDGRWHDMKTNADGTTEESFCEPGRGVFRVGQNKLYLLSEAPIGFRRSRKTEDYTKSPQYVRTETVQGFSTVVQSPGLGAQMYLAPELDGDWIKFELPDGNGMRVFEPILIVIGEPDSARFLHQEFAVSDEVVKQSQGTEK